MSQELCLFCEREKGDTCDSWVIFAFLRKRVLSRNTVLRIRSPNTLVLIQHRLSMKISGAHSLVLDFWTLESNLQPHPCTFESTSVWRKERSLTEYNEHWFYHSSTPITILLAIVQLLHCLSLLSKHGIEELAAEAVINLDCIGQYSKEVLMYFLELYICQYHCKWMLGRLS